MGAMMIPTMQPVFTPRNGVNGPISTQRICVVQADPAPRLSALAANHVLALVPRAGLDGITALFDSVQLSTGSILWEADFKPRYMYFPTSAIVSLASEMADGSPTEICAVGNDGFVGFELVTGCETTCSRAIVTSAGHAFRLEARYLGSELSGTAVLTPALLRYTQTLVSQIAKTAVCNRHHSIEQQLCRRLLFILDRLPADEVIVTHGMLADMLGVRRESISLAASKLQCAGVIECDRGRIKIVNRQSLETRACECYAIKGFAPGAKPRNQSESVVPARAFPTAVWDRRSPDDTRFSSISERRRRIHIE